MRAQVLLMGGPYNERIIPIGTVDGEWPTEIRVASGDREIDGKIDCQAYVKIDVSDAWPIRFGHYRHVGNKLSARTLISVWM